MLHKKSRAASIDLTVGNPFRSLLRFAMPVIGGNLFQLFYTLADSVIVGKTLWQLSVLPALLSILFYALSRALPTASASVLDNTSAPVIPYGCAEVLLYPRFCAFS